MADNLLRNAKDRRNDPTGGNAPRASGGRRAHVVSTVDPNIGWFDENATPRGTDDERAQASRMSRIIAVFSVVYPETEPARQGQQERRGKNQCRAHQIAWDGVFTPAAALATPS